MATATYAQLTEQTDLQDADLLAAYRSTGPLKRFTASVLKTYIGTDYLKLDGSTTMTGALVAAVGAEGTPGIVFAADADTGVWHPAANTMAWSTGGVERMRVSSAGLGMSAAINFRASQDVASATTTDLGAATSNVVRITGTTTITGFGTTADGVWRFGTFAGALTLTYNATSLILPGGTDITTAAGDTFEALSLGSGNWRVIRYTRATGKSVIAPAVGDITGLGTGVATFLATPSSANLAAAVTNETGTGALVFATSPTFVTPILGTPTSGTLTNCTLPVGGVTGLGTGVATFLATPSSANLRAALTDETGTGGAVFATSPTITTPTLNGTPVLGSASGWRSALALGTSALVDTGTSGATVPLLNGVNTWSASQLFPVAAGTVVSGTDIVATNTVGWILDGPTGSLALCTAGSASLYVNRKATDGACTNFYRQGVLVGTISVTGSATAYNTSSDYRLKTDFKPLDAGKIIDRVKVYDFAWKATGKRSCGVMAHELQKIFPQAVSGKKDATNKDGSIDPQGVDYSKLVPILLAEVQSLRSRVAGLEAGGPMASARGRARSQGS